MGFIQMSWCYQIQDNVESLVFVIIEIRGIEIKK